MSSDSDEENIIRYGTPLEPFEEDEIPSKRKYQEPTDQYAVDAHGRRRFHGAFTGGFSAGHGNTVGTPEGWAPATFKSSRSEKAQASSQRPEDFMDEEDRGEFGIAPRQMQTHSEFSGQKRPRQKQYHDGPIPGEPVLSQLLEPVHETAAVKMLRAMGWRPGQGAGERTSKKEKKQAKEQRKVYGCYMPEDLRPNQADQESSSSDSEFDYETLFAPDDYEPYVLARKNDRFGLGYSGLSKHSVLGNLVGEYGESSSTSHLVMKDKGKRVSIRGQAFGVGAFEADDEDIYATEDMSHYDFTIGGDQDKKKPTGKAKEEANVLEGFVRASKPLPSLPLYPPPALPRDYTPLPAGARRSRFQPSDADQRDQGLGRHELTPNARGQLLGETPVPPIQSTTQLPLTTNGPPSNVLGPPPNVLGPPSNVLEPPQSTPTKLIVDASSKDDPIAKLLGRNVNFVSKNAEESSSMDYIPIKDSGKDLPKVFKPFISNPSKQARYETFLKDRDNYAREQDSNMDRLSEWERDRELVEFEQAAKLYRPLTGEMGDRFTHASEPDEAVNPLCAVAKSTTNYGLATPEQIEAAKKGVYGVMTRKECSWRPEGLVCKRFNVPEPGGRSEPQKEDKPKVSYSVFSYLENPVHDKESFAREQSKFSGSKSLTEIKKPPTNKDQTPSTNTPAATSKSNTKNNIQNVPSTSKSDTEKVTSINETGHTKRLTVAELFLKESEKDLKDKNKGLEVTETIEKFDKMALYKSIFLSDSENEEEPVQEIKNKVIDLDDLLDVPKNIERNTSPPRGIFANINFDELNSWRRPDSKKSDKDTSTTKEQERQKTETQHTNNPSNSSDKVQPETEVYGPKIPENLQKQPENPIEDFRPIFRSKDKKQDVIDVLSSSSDSWVDAKEISKKDKKKKKKKHKAKHKKSKHKKKDR